jgi:fatty acid desaturase
MFVEPSPVCTTPPALCDAGTPLPPALRGDRNALGRDSRQALKRLAGRQPGRFLLRLAACWIAVGGAIVVADYYQCLLLRILAVFFIATRQNVLALLLHEQVHRLAFRSRWGDAFCNLTIAYPLAITVEGYRQIHLAHHRYYFTQRDPDYVRKQGKEWTFPQRARELLKTFFVIAAGIHTWRLLQSKTRTPSSPGPWARPALPWLRLLYYAILIGLLVGTRTWPRFLAYWVLPLLTAFQVIVHWAAICEHKYDLINPSIPASTPFIRPRWWESIVLPNLNFHAYHVYHHWYPAIPYTRLPAVHELFRREGLVNEQNVFRGYHTYLRYIVTGKHPASAYADGPSKDQVA